MKDVDLGDNSTSEKAYLDLLKKCLTRYLFGERYRPLKRPEKFENSVHRLLWALYYPAERLLSSRGLEIVHRVPFDPLKRMMGEDWPAEAETLIGLKRLDNLGWCIQDVVTHGVPGDLIETGTWRGGAAIFMRAALKAYHDTERVVWVADSFEGLPTADIHRYPEDEAADWLNPYWKPLAVPLEDVKANFDRYGLLDDQVRFLVGWFKDTLPGAPIERLAVLRLDGDMYGSTMDSLENLYSRLSIGGYAIVDDYDKYPCRKAVEEFRSRWGSVEELIYIDRQGVFWQRQK
jgi:O-methyltransferase